MLVQVNRTCRMGVVQEAPRNAAGVSAIEYTLLDLPALILQCILAFLDPQSIKSLGSTCTGERLGWRSFDTSGRSKCLWALQGTAVSASRIPIGLFPAWRLFNNNSSSQLATQDTVTKSTVHPAIRRLIPRHPQGVHRP